MNRYRLIVADADNDTNVVEETSFNADPQEAKEIAQDAVDRHQAFKYGTAPHLPGYPDIPTRRLVGLLSVSAGGYWEPLPDVPTKAVRG